MKRLLSALSASVALMFFMTGVAAAAPAHSSHGGGGTTGGSGTPNPYYVTGQVGEDVSYPNCSATLGGSFGVVGVNDGIVYGQNSCLAQEAAHYSDLSLYANTGLNADPTTSTYYQQAQVGCNGDVMCAAYNYGYNAGVSAVQTAQAAGVSSTRWWLDVENGNTWNADTNQNRQELTGERQALLDNGATMVGVYSTTAQWDGITGTWQNGWYTWGATTWTSARQAAKYCTGHEFTGGQTLLIQYSGTVDQDYAC